MAQNERQASSRQEVEDDDDDVSSICCCLGSKKKDAQPVTLIKSEPIVSAQPKETDAIEMNGISTKTAERSIGDDEQLSAVHKPVTAAQAASPDDAFNITDIAFDALCTEEETAEQIVEDAPEISSNVIEAVDEAELEKMTTKPVSVKNPPADDDNDEEEITFNQMIAEDYERKKKALLREIEETEKIDREQEAEDMRDLEDDEDLPIERARSASVEKPSDESQPSTSRVDEQTDSRQRSEDDLKVERQLMDEIESLDLRGGDLDDEADSKFEAQRQSSERELREVEAQLKARAADDTDLESDDDEVMVDRFADRPKLPASTMYAQMSESDDDDDESDDEEREVIVPPPRLNAAARKPPTQNSDDEDSGTGNTREDLPRQLLIMQQQGESFVADRKACSVDSSSEKENGRHVTRVSIKSSGPSTVVDSAQPVTVSATLTDDEFSEKLI